MYVVSIIFAAFLILVTVKKGKVGLINSRFYMFLAIASIAWWILLLTRQLNQDFVCTSGDSLCNNLNTFWGTVSWANMLAVLSLLLVWAIAFAVGQTKRAIAAWQSPKPKKK